LFVKPHDSVDLFLVVGSTKTEMEGTKTEMEGTKTEKEESTNERIIKGSKIEIELPAGATYVWLRPVMTLKKEELKTKISFDIQGKHDMGYTPWKLEKVTNRQREWVHDQEKIDERNKKEAFEAAVEALHQQKCDDDLSEWRATENQIAAEDLQKFQTM
jgi:hypothetical protein